MLPIPKRGPFIIAVWQSMLPLLILDGFDLKMPTDFDDFTERAHLSYTQLDEDVLAHRELLRLAMTRRGFNSLETEWWHYTFASSEQYPLLTIPFEHLIL